MTPIDINLNDYVTSGHVVAGTVSGAGLTGPTGTYSPPAGMNGTETVTYQVQNGCQQTAQGELTIDVNRAPVGGNITRNLSRGDTLGIQIGELASDDEALSIVTPLTGAPSWVSSDGTSLTATPPGNTPSGTYSFNVTVQDLGLLTAATTVNLVISNLPPTALADNYQTDQQPFSFDPTQNDTDSDPGPLSIQSISWSPASDSPITVTGTLVTVAAPHGTSTLNYTIVDSGGLTASSTITITYNRAPTIQSDTESTNGQLTAHVPLQIVEPDGDPVSVVCQSSDPQVSVLVEANPNPGPPAPDAQHPKFELEVTVTEEFKDSNGTAIIHCGVRDSFGAIATADITITVN
jgi:hypothetical protein